MDSLRNSDPSKLATALDKEMMIITQELLEMPTKIVSGTGK